MIEGVGKGSARWYMLSSKVYSIINNKAKYARQRGWDMLQERELILTRLSKIAREDVVELCRCTPDHAFWLLRQLVNDIMIQLCGAGRSAFYKRSEKL